MDNNVDLFVTLTGTIHFKAVETYYVGKASTENANGTYFLHFAIINIKQRRGSRDDTFPILL